MYTALVSGKADERTYTAYDNGKEVFTTTDPDIWAAWYAENEAKFQAPEPVETDAELIAQMEVILSKLKAKRK